MNKILLALFVFQVFVSSAFAQSGYEYELDIKKRTGMYSEKDISFDQVVIELTKFNPQSDSPVQDQKINELFKYGESLWQESGAKQTYMLPSSFRIKRLCDAAIGYYISVGRLYMAVPFLQKLLDETKRTYMVDMEADTLGRMMDINLTLGQTEATKELIIRFQNLINDYFTIDINSVEDNDTYSTVVNSEMWKNKIRLMLLDGSTTNDIIEAQKFFDYIIKFYDYNFITPFFQLAGILNSEAAFMQYDKESIANGLYYNNYEMLYYFAQLFAINGDKERALKALSMAEKAVNSNASGDVSASSIMHENSTAHKEITSMAAVATSTEPQVLRRIPYRYNYLGSLYKAVILSKLGNYAEASTIIEKTEKHYEEMSAYYETLPAEYTYNDKIYNSLPQQILTLAQIENHNKNFAEADKAYSSLIDYYEKVRNSMPVKLRRGFFRGYSKGAYLGLIENRAQAYLASPDSNSFEKFIEAVSMMNARQFKDISTKSNIQSASYTDVQASLTNNDLVYIIIETEKNIISAGITNSKTGITITKKPKGLKASLDKAKFQLVEKNIYNMTKLEELTTNVTSPIKGFIQKGNIHAIVDGAISVIPLEIYPVNGKMLFNDYNIDYMVTLDTIKSDNKISGETNFLGIADPIYDNTSAEKVASVEVSTNRSVAISGYFAPLPETRDEVREIAAGMILSKLLMGSEAAESIIKSLPMKQYNIVHFATHGILGGEIPGIDEPALVLSGENGEDSLLTASEISALELNAKLVVLSACNTGSGKYFRGEGVTGIARAFKIAGTDTVVASLWPVDSLATKKLMTLFYKFVQKGQAVPKALHMAKQKLQTEAAQNNSAERAIKSKNTIKKEYKGYDNPYYWSAFICISS